MAIQMDFLEASGLGLGPEGEARRKGKRKRVS